MNITHKQHYVQQKYLKSWLSQNQFWVYDKQTQKFSHKGTNAVCFEKDYYKLYRLSDDEHRFLDVLYKKLPSILSQRIYEFCDLMSSEVVIESNDDNTRKIITKVFNENRQEIESQVYTQMGESILCDIEQGICDRVWEGLLNEDECLIQNEQIRTNLYGYIVSQIWRVPTKKRILNEAIKK